MTKLKKQKKLRHNEYYRLQDTFDRLYAKSLQGDNFSNLMTMIKSPENIKLAYRNIKSNKGSMTYGTDKITIEDIESIPTDKYIEMVQRKLNFYKPKPVRRVEILKPNGKTRPLGIPTMIDRLVQQSILQVLEPICEAKFHERNNGFRPNRSAENAIAQCYRMIQQQNLHYVVDIDIKGFFDNVNHSKLIKRMWTLGIRDKKLLCIIKEMLKAPVIMQSGEIQYPTCGTPQGGILSPLLSNIVLNELDWWISSQWENIPTYHKYNIKINKSGSERKSAKYEALKKTELKEMYLVRYADDFKIFCRKRSDADKVFIAVKLWLQDRLKLEISDEKSRVVNLKKHYSEFLGFKLKTVKKGNKYVVRSRMRDKAVKNVADKLIEQIKKIQHPKNIKCSVLEIQKYNQMVEGFHNYYRYATDIIKDCQLIQRRVYTVIQNRLRQRLKQKGIIDNRHIKEKYGKSKQMRFVDHKPLIPVGYIQTKSPMYKKRSICKFTVEGRKEMHKNLQFDSYVLWVLGELSHTHRKYESIEYTDNRISLYAAQYGKCKVFDTVLDIDDIHCHHIIPKVFGGTDKYNNLVILHKDIHTLVHAVNQEIINKYLEKTNLDKKQIKKVNDLRKKACREPIEIQA